MAARKPTLMILILGLTAINLGLLAFNLVASAKAEVAGKDWFELAKDDDFRQAVGYIVSKCMIDMEQPPGMSPKIYCG